MSAKIIITCLTICFGFTQKAISQYNKSSLSNEALLKESIVLPAFRPDRPGLTKTSLTVFPNSLYYQSGFRFFSTNENYGFSVEQFSIRIGLNRKLETELDLYLYKTRDVLSKSPGFQGLDINFRLHLSGSNYYPVTQDYNTSILSGIEVFRINHQKPELSFILLHDQKLDFYGFNFTSNIGYSDNPIDTKNSFFVSTQAYSHFHNGLDLNVKNFIGYSLFSNSLNRRNFDHIIDFGFTTGDYFTFQFDLAFGASLHENFVYIEVGMVKKFGRY